MTKTSYKLYPSIKETLLKYKGGLIEDKLWQDGYRSRNSHGKVPIVRSIIRTKQLLIPQRMKRKCTEGGTIQNPRCQNPTNTNFSYQISWSHRQIHKKMRRHRSMHWATNGNRRDQHGRKYVKEIDTLTTERARLDKEATDCLLVTPKETTPIQIKPPHEVDKVKIRVDLKPETLANDATPVEFRIWTKEFKVFFRSSNLWKGEKIEQQQALIKLIDSVLAAKLRGKIDDDTPVFTDATAAQNMAGEAIPLDAQPQGTSFFAILETHFKVSNPLFKQRSELLKLKPTRGEQFTSYMNRLKETSEECDLHNISHEDVIS